MKSRLLAIGLCALLGACADLYPPEGPAPPAPPPPPPSGPPAAFRGREMDWSAERGSATILGSVNYQRSGKHYVCSGPVAVLTPDAPYSRRRIVQLYGSADQASLPMEEVRSRQANRPSDEYSAYVRHASCDASGRFAFRGLPAGGWFVIVVANPDGGGQGMALMRRVETRAGGVRTVDFR